MTTNYKKRIMVSKDGACPMQCAHCFTYELPEMTEIDTKNRRTNDEIISDIQDESFDIIYVSHTCENFLAEEDGLDLCGKLYERYEKDIFIITRSFLADETIEKLADLNNRMGKQGHRLYLAVSCFANNSYGISENTDICPSPEERLSNLERAYNAGIATFLILRPVFPDEIVSVKECTYLVCKARKYINAVISSGLIVTDQILARLKLDGTQFKYLQNGDSDYLKNMPKENARYLDVEKELEEIQSCCRECNIPFFRHSMPALNYISAIHSL